MDLRFASDRYDHELHRKEQLTAGLTLPVGFLTILCGGIVAMARSFWYHDALVATVFVPVLTADAFTVGVCLVFLARAYRPQRYLYLPLLRDLLDWERQYADFARDFQQDGARVEHAFLDRMIEATDRNTVNNDTRSELLYRARVALFAVLCLTALAGIPYVINHVRHEMSKQETPAPPPAPPNREIREGRVTPRRG